MEPWEYTPAELLPVEIGVLERELAPHLSDHWPTLEETAWVAMSLAHPRTLFQVACARVRFLARCRELAVANAGRIDKAQCDALDREYVEAMRAALLRLQQLEEEERRGPA